jgi:hypothetical protein
MITHWLGFGIFVALLYCGSQINLIVSQLRQLASIEREKASTLKQVDASLANMSPNAEDGE